MPIMQNGTGQFGQFPPFRACSQNLNRNKLFRDRNNSCIQWYVWDWPIQCLVGCGFLPLLLQQASAEHPHSLGTANQVSHGLSATEKGKKLNQITNWNAQRTKRTKWNSVAYVRTVPQHTLTTTIKHQGEIPYTQRHTQVSRSSCSRVT